MTAITLKNNRGEEFVVYGERTLIRCPDVSLRHRAYGIQCGFTDLDFVGIEFRSRQPTCLIDYKHWRGRVDRDSASFRVQQEIADRCKLPMFIARYCPINWCYEVHACNAYAKSKCPTSRPLTEQAYMRWMHEVREAEWRERERAWCARLNDIAEPHATSVNGSSGMIAERDDEIARLREYAAKADREIARLRCDLEEARRPIAQDLFAIMNP